MFDLSDLQDLADRAGVPVILAQQHAPLLALIAAMLPAAPTATAGLPPIPPGFDVHRSYTKEEAGDFLGIKARSVTDIPDDELPRTRVGVTRTAVRFVGLDLLCYRHKLSPFDWAAVRDEAEHQLMRPPHAARGVRSMPGAAGPRRVV